jgi:transcriptional regulator with XRE-family HTH domain
MGRVIYVLGARLKYLREKKEFSQEEISKELNMARSTYAHYELDKRNPSYDVIKLFADYFKVSIDYLLGHTDDPAPRESLSEVDQYKDELHKRPELKILFDTSKNAKKEDIEKAVSYIEFLKKQSEGGFNG